MNRLIKALIQKSAFDITDSGVLQPQPYFHLIRRSKSSRENEKVVRVTKHQDYQTGYQVAIIYSGQDSSRYSSIAMQYHRVGQQQVQEYSCVVVQLLQKKKTHLSKIRCQLEARAWGILTLKVIIFLARKKVI